MVTKAKSPSAKTVRFKLTDRVTFECSESVWKEHEESGLTEPTPEFLLLLGEAMYGDEYGDYPDSNDDLMVFLEALPQSRLNAALEDALVDDAIIRHQLEGGSLP